MSPEEREEALTFLKSPDLVERIGELFSLLRLGRRAEQLFSRVLGCTSRKL